LQRRNLSNYITAIKLQKLPLKITAAKSQQLTAIKLQLEIVIAKSQQLLLKNL